MSKPWWMKNFKRWSRSFKERTSKENYYLITHLRFPTPAVNQLKCIIMEKLSPKNLARKLNAWKRKRPHPTIVAKLKKNRKSQILQTTVSPLKKESPHPTTNSKSKKSLICQKLQVVSPWRRRYHHPIANRAKSLKKVLRQAFKTNPRQNLGKIGLEQ